MTPTEIKVWLDDLWNILIDMNISINNAKRLTENNYENEEKIKKHGFIQHHWYQLRFIIVIQLSKLIANNKDTHKRNLFHFCNKLESTKLDVDFFKELNKLQPRRYFEADTTPKSIQEVIDKTRNKLDQNSSLIKQIIDARNQIYAHNDPIPDKKAPVMRDLGVMVQLCNEIYNDISGELFKSRTGFEHTKDWNIDYILKELSHRRTQILEERERRRKGI
ncbi:MAG: hypothetical protein VYB44_15880 [Bacteroidota bacterium]|nr:hypothetical protein [Bacteroidota bacterium]